MDYRSHRPGRWAARWPCRVRCRRLMVVHGGTRADAARANEAGCGKTAAAPKPAHRRSRAGAAKPAAAAAAASQAAQQPQLMYSPWMKVCGTGPGHQQQESLRHHQGRPAGKRHAGCDRPVVRAGRRDQKVLRVTVPLGMQLQHGTRMIIDPGHAGAAPYMICFPVGCMADYPVDDDMVGKMKKGQRLTVQAINMQGTPISLPMPLSRFRQSL